MSGAQSLQCRPGPVVVPAKARARVIRLEDSLEPSPGRAPAEDKGCSVETKLEELVGEMAKMRDLIIACSVGQQGEESSLEVKFRQKLADAERERETLSVRYVELEQKMRQDEERRVREKKAARMQCAELEQKLQREKDLRARYAAPYNARMDELETTNRELRVEIDEMDSVVDELNELESWKQEAEREREISAAQHVETERKLNQVELKLQQEVRWRREMIPKCDVEAALAEQSSCMAKMVEDRTLAARSECGELRKRDQIMTKLLAEVRKENGRLKEAINGKR